MPPMPFQSPPVVDQNGRMDGQLKRLVSMSDLDFAHWVEEVFKPYMWKNHEPYFHGQAIHPAEGGGMSSKRGITISGKENLRQSSMTLGKDGRITIDYRAPNQGEAARYIAEQFSGLLFAGRHKGEGAPAIHVDLANFEFETPEKVAQSRLFFIALFHAFRAVGLEYKIPSHNSSSEMWGIVNGWMDEAQGARPAQSRPRDVQGVFQQTARSNGPLDPVDPPELRT
jgi:hypothetical protein